MKVIDIQKVVDSTAFTSIKKKFVSSLYWNLVAAGYKPCIVNEKYIEIDGTAFHFVMNKRDMSYTAVVF